MILCPFQLTRGVKLIGLIPACPYLFLTTKPYLPQFYQKLGQKQVLRFFPGKIRAIDDLFELISCDPDLYDL